jgi:DNA topoisomerase-2
LNVREATVQQLANNVEINNIKQIVGLQHGKKYKDLSELRYGKIEILTDADHDGSHIKGLIINFIHHFWPELLELGFISSMITPIIKAVKGSVHHEFYTMSDYNKWKESLTMEERKKFNIKYYKGLGTSTAQEAKAYFRKKLQNTVNYIGDENTANCIELAFKKDKADARKDWIVNGIKRNEALEYSSKTQNISYDDFINKDLIWFSISDLKRSIPSVVDGFKPSQRKVIYASRKRTNTEIKVSQLGAYVANESSYHHGEQSLNGTIINLAQDYVGSNNMNLLEPIGQFGTRLLGGKDHASPRYIFTRLSKYCIDMFHKDDDPILTYLDDDGTLIEPEYYVPKLPLVLINGAEGIGTGYSSFVPCYNPDEVKTNIQRLLQNKEMKNMKPWYKNFKGTIEATSDEEDHYITKGVYKITNPSTIEITELPIGKWTQDYKEFLETLLDVKIRSYNNNCSETDVHFIVKMEPSDLKKMNPDDIYKEFKLTSTLSIKNMHLFDSKNNIKKYISPLEIIREFAEVKLVYYQKRKDHLIDKHTKQMTLLKNKVKFTSMITKEELVIFKKKKDVINSELQYLKFDKVDDSYDYLLNMKLYSLTEEQIMNLEKEYKQVKNVLEETQSKTVHEMWENDM